MKNILLTLLSAVIGVLTLMIVMTLDGRIHRSMELHSNFPSIIEETLYHLTSARNYTILDTEELLADITEQLAVTLDASTDLTLDVFACDEEKGLLSICATASFLHPNGKTGTVTCERTVILDKIPSVPLSSYDVQFYVNDTLYKKYTLMENDNLTAPVSPQPSNGTLFYGWYDAFGNAADFSQPVLKNITYYADIH